MRTSRWLSGALAAAAVVAAGVLVARLGRSPALGPMVTSPPERTLSLRVGDSLRFTVVAEGAERFVWSRWGQEVAAGAAWTFVAGPEDAGWQQVTVAAIGRRGTRLARTWDVGVVAPAVPELTEMDPPPGLVSVLAGEATSLRCRARLDGARPADRLRFEWIVDGETVLRDERPVGAATSAMLLPAYEGGRHVVRVRVTEDERTAALAEWTIEVVRPATAPPPPIVAVLPPMPSPVTDTPPPSSAIRSASAPRLVRSPVSPRAEVAPGETLLLRAALEPEPARATYAWMVDGRIVQDAPNPRFDFVQGKPGRHRVTVTAIVDGRPVATDAWQVAVVAPPPPDAAQGVPSAPPEGASAPGRLAEEEVRRWLDDYARAWSRKDVGTLQRMGQVRSTTEAERLERYFHSIDDLHVDVRVIALRVEGGQAVVDFERTDTVTDPAGQRRQLRLPPFHKEIERTPGGLRFRGGEG